jgi:GNAT superfamily N-acetyltransferase
VTEAPEVVTRTYLEMRSPSDLRPARVPDPAPTIELVSPPDGALSRELYLAVGRDWWWTDRQDWTAAQWDGWAAGAATWVFRFDGERIGYGELSPREPGEAGDVELAYFGLLPGWTGRGLGGHLLTELVRRAWETPGIQRLFLSTGTLDSDAALPGYVKRGFVPFKRLEEPPPAPPRLAGGP